VIIFGKPIHRKYTNTIKKIFLCVIAVLIFLFFVSCSKIEFSNFDPKTSTLKYIITREH
jgi:hypothetical protein